MYEENKSTKLGRTEFVVEEFERMLKITLIRYFSHCGAIYS